MTGHTCRLVVSVCGVHVPANVLSPPRLARHVLFGGGFCFLHFTHRNKQNFFHSAAPSKKKQEGMSKPVQSSYCHFHHPHLSTHTHTHSLSLPPPPPPPPPPSPRQVRPHTMHLPPILLPLKHTHTHTHTPLQQTMPAKIIDAYTHYAPLALTEYLTNECNEGKPLVFASLFERIPLLTKVCVYLCVYVYLFWLLLYTHINEPYIHTHTYI
jgi:hypothetical protein